MADTNKNPNTNTNTSTPSTSTPNTSATSPSTSSAAASTQPGGGDTASTSYPRIWLIQPVTHDGVYYRENSYTDKIPSDAATRLIDLGYASEYKPGEEPSEVSGTANQPDGGTNENPTTNPDGTPPGTGSTTGTSTPPSV